jgi:arginyl-tRNA synthetase
MPADIQEFLLCLLRQALSRAGFSSGAGMDLYLEVPADNRFGDFSSNIALRLAKETGKPPRRIAAEICAAAKEALASSGEAAWVEEVKAEGAGFINFYLSRGFLCASLQEAVSSAGESLKPAGAAKPPVLIEFVSANPTGALSVAHARQAAVGDALANILEFMGRKVGREYYLNDEGNQINILGRSVELRMQELAGKKIEFPEDCYQGEYIYDIARQAAAKNIPAPQLGDFAAGYILAIIRKELDDLGVKFDCWYSQKELSASGKIAAALDALREKGFLYNEGGAVWFKSTAFGDDKDRVVVKSDGSYTYLAPDIAYHEEKYKRGCGLLINLWGPDHHGYISRLKAAAQAFGHAPDSLSIVIVQLASIFRQGVPVQMSTRRGEYITLREVLEEVGRDAARFFFLMRRTSSHLDFDLEVAKKQTPENPVYYVQYAHARICSILRGAAIKPGGEFDLALLKEEEEATLMKKALQFPIVLGACAAASDPYFLTVYLQELAESFHKFYDSHRVIGQEDGLTRARLVLIDAARIVLAKGLGLLGVSCPQRM